MEQPIEILSGKVIDALKNLTSKELTSFSLFVQSPYFNKKENLSKFLNFLLKYHPQFDHKKFTAECAFKHIFSKNIAFNKSKINALKSELNKLLHQFLTIEQIDKEPNTKQFLFLRALNQKRLDKKFISECKESINNISERKEYSNLMYWKYAFEKQDYMFSVNRKGRLTDNVKLLSVADNLDQYYFVEKLRLACSFLNRQYTDKSDARSTFPLLSNIIAQLTPTSQSHLVNFYIFLFQLLKNENKTEQEQIHFQGLINYLHKFGELIDKHELRQIFTVVLNYCSRNSRKGNLSYYQKMFDWYKYLLEKEVLFDENNYFAPHQHYRNIVVTGLLLNKLKWTENFIENYKIHLNKKIRTQIINYCLAELNFYKKNYKVSIKYLNKFNSGSKDNIQFIEHKRLLSKVYFETDDYEVLKSTLKAFDEYLRRKKQDLAPNFLESNKGFIKMLKEIIRLKTDPNRTHCVKKLSDSFEKTPLISDRKWINKTIQDIFK